MSVDERWALHNILYDCPDTFLAAMKELRDDIGCFADSEEPGNVLHGDAIQPIRVKRGTKRHTDQVCVCV